ncbi:MAG: relaxase domain-containing protein, partial [Isosphaeraceae bacterium]|nr:relaxase domain-containing protein [Isosphaeraceae bacterium]
MLRIIQNASASGAKSYYSTADYYAEGQELAGHWRGKGTAMLGLAGEVDRASWDALCDNRHPLSGQPLTLRSKDHRTIGYDINFHVPKSVSVLYGLTRDERVLDAFRESVGETMRDMESEMQTRVRKGGRYEDRTTGNLVWGEFIHFTSRPVDGIPDPHLHAHCFAFNSTWDAEERAWKAGQFRNLKRDAPYFQAVFHSKLADRLADQGYEIRRTAKGWEIAGVSDGVIDKFSRRRDLIERTAEEEGITDELEKDKLGAKTREGKVKGLSEQELVAEWRGRLSDKEWSDVSGVRQNALPGQRVRDSRAAEEAMQYAIGHCFERRSVVPERQLFAEALKSSVGRATVEQVTRQAAPSGVVFGNVRGRKMVTTPGVLAEERKMIEFARRGRGTRRPLGDPNRPFSRDWLNEDQKRAVRHVLSSPDRVMIVRGAAGVGKTSLMQEAAEGIRAGGRQVFAFAPTAGASRGVLRDAGFTSAETVARLLMDDKIKSQVKGQVIWIDEAGLLGSRTMSRVFDLAERAEARVILSGDRRQHKAVERGSPLRLLEEEAGIVPGEVREIKRQKGEYKLAVKALGEGRTGEGFDRLDGLG